VIAGTEIDRPVGHRRHIKAPPAGRRPDGRPARPERSPSHHVADHLSISRKGPCWAP